MGTLQETHEGEVSAKGWSGWDMLAAGAGYSVFPRFGEALLNDATNDEERRIAHLLIDFKNESDAETLDAEKEFWEQREEETLTVFLWLAMNPARAFDVTDSSGRRVLSYIGDGLVYFGENTKSFPGATPYSSEDGGWKRWSEDCIRVGRALSAEDLSYSGRACDFLSKWLWHLWS